MTTDKTKYKRAAEDVRQQLLYHKRDDGQGLRDAIDLCERMAAGELVERSAERVRVASPDCSAALEDCGKCDYCTGDDL